MGGERKPSHLETGDKPPQLRNENLVKKKSKDVPRQAEVALRVPCSLKPRIISTFGTTRVVVCQPYAPAAFTPGESLVLIFRG